MKLTYLEATKVLKEAYRLKTQFRSSSSRLGQSIYWTTNDELSSLDLGLRDKLVSMLLAYHGTEGDFYYLEDEETLSLFYKLYVVGE
jgi:hypothetical protein